MFNSSFWQSFTAGCLSDANPHHLSGLLTASKEVRAVFPCAEISYFCIPLAEGFVRIIGMSEVQHVELVILADGI